MSVIPMQLYNTRTLKVEPFKPLKDKQVKLYTCGPTVYSYVHIGNMRAYLFSDTLRRALKVCDYKVNHVMNITDVGHLTDDGNDGEDKLEVGAKKENLSVWQVAEKYTNFFFDECKKLNILDPSVVCKATDYIVQQIDLVKQLEEKGFTYKTSDGIYFATTKFKEYKNFAKLCFDGMAGGKRVALGEKKHLADFALWKFSPAGSKRAMEWESPWGVGFPGWHVECSAMAMALLGDQLDIHTGGVDHIPVHHTNEIAQSECASGKTPFANYWMHCEFLILDDGTQKMSKSLGNIITIHELDEKGFDPLAFRYLCLMSHYRKQMQFSIKSLEGACAAYRRLRLLCSKFMTTSDPQKVLELKKSKRVDDYEKQFLAALTNDLNTSQVLANLWKLLEDTDLTGIEKSFLIHKHEQFLGLKCSEPYQEKSCPVTEEASALLKKRIACRDQKDWAGADLIRDQLKELGYEIADSKEGPYLKRISEKSS